MNPFSYDRSRSPVSVLFFADRFLLRSLSSSRDSRSSLSISCFDFVGASVVVAPRELCFAPPELCAASPELCA